MEMEGFHDLVVSEWGLLRKLQSLKKAIQNWYGVTKKVKHGLHDENLKKY